jgi:NAD(P)-dependent dehydrogenase (short-subunit alcohol dehydrogenase family)
LTDLFQLDGQIAVVTGALGKLGPIWVQTLLGAGASVLALDRTGQPVCEPVEQLQRTYDENRLCLAEADVTNRGEVERALAGCEQKLGIPTILVNNAGIDQPPGKDATGSRLEDIPIEINRQILEVNTLGLFVVTQVFGGRMAESGGGSIINIGSLYASVSPDAHFYDHIKSDPPFLKPPAYGASKAAVLNLTKYLATFWAPSGVRVNALSPGGVRGGQDADFMRKFCKRVPMGRMANATDLQGPLLFLASRASAYVTGINLKVDGGFTVW